MSADCAKQLREALDASAPVYGPVTPEWALLGSIGLHCVEEAKAGRPVPAWAYVHPLKFWALVRHTKSRLNAEPDVAYNIDLFTSVGIVKVGIDEHRCGELQSNDDVRYEVAT